MDGKSPFSEGERGEIRQYCRAQFEGGNLPDELADVHARFNVLLRAFLISVDRRTGSFLQLPTSGGSLEQPSKTMAVFECMQMHYVDHIARENEKAMKKKS